VALYDAIGPGNWAEFETIVQWWEDPATVAWVNGADANGHLRSECLILNLAVEAGPATGSPYTRYVNAYTDAITRLRSCVVGDPCHTAPTRIDADGWGRDDASLVAGAPAWIAADPHDNLIMSWHPYTAWSAQQLRSRMDRLVSTGPPVIVSEFANKEPTGRVTYPTPCTGGQPLYKDITAEANLRGFGWLVWAWGDKPASPDYRNADCWERAQLPARASLVDGDVAWAAFFYAMEEPAEARLICITCQSVGKQRSATPARSHPPRGPAASVELVLRGSTQLHPKM
jgi:hypothetical protein